MSNTLFRKGLVAAAIVALGSAGVAAVPAQAASVLFAPSTGTGNTLVAGETFSLTASLSSDLPASNASQLKFKVTNTTGVATTTVNINAKSILAPQAAAGGTPVVGAHDAAYGQVTLDPSVWTNPSTPTYTSLSGDLTGTSAGTSKVFAAGPASATDAAVVQGASSETNPTTVSITSPVDTTADYTVTAWLDANNNGVVDSGELSADQTVHFVKIANSGIAVNFSAPTQSAGTVNGTLSFAAGVNLSQLTLGKYGIGFGRYITSGLTNAVAAQTSATSLISLSNGIAASSYDSTNNVLKLSGAQTANYWNAASTPAANATGVVAGNTYTAQPFYGNLSGTRAAVGTSVSAVAAATQANSDAGLSAALGDNVKGSYIVRTGTTAVALTDTIKATPSAGGTDVAVGAGVAVDVYVTAFTPATPSGSTTADTVTVAGVTVIPTSSSSTNVSSSTKIATVTTDASGKISVPVTSSLGTAGQSVTVSVKVPNSAAVTSNATLAWSDNNGLTVTDLGSGTHTVVKGGAVQATYALTDSFAALVKTGTYQLVATSQGIGSPAPSSQTVYVPFVNGLANLSLTDNSTTTGSNNVVTLTLQKQTNGLWQNVATSGVGNYVIANVTVPSSTSFAVLAAAPVAASVTVPAALTSTTTGATRDVAATFATVDTRQGNSATATPSGFTGSSAQTINGVVADASGVGIAGVPVTVTAAGIQFTDGAGVWAVGSITVTTGTNGAYSVTAYSHTAGKVTFTATSGAATKSTSIYFAQPTADTSGATVVITSPATAASGTNVTVTAVLTDKFGNPVSVVTDGYFTLTVSGIGATQTVKRLGTDGTAIVNIALGANDSGTLAVTAAYSADAGTTATDTKTASVKVGAAAVAALTSVAAQAQAQTGSAVSVTATAKDAAGAAIKGAVISFTATGAGYLSAATATTDANGVATVKLIGNVAGANSVVASANGTSAAAVAVTFGQSDASLSVAGHRVTAAWSYAAGKKVVITRDGVRIKSVVASDDAADSFSFNVSKKGTHKVTVSVAGVVTDVITVK